MRDSVTKCQASLIALFAAHSIAGDKIDCPRLSTSMRHNTQAGHNSPRRRAYAAMCCCRRRNRLHRCGCRVAQARAEAILIDVRATPSPVRSCLPGPQPGGIKDSPPRGGGCEAWYRAASRLTIIHILSLDFPGTDLEQAHQRQMQILLCRAGRLSAGRSGIPAGRGPDGSIHLAKLLHRQRCSFFAT